SVYILYYLTLLIFVPHLYFSLYRVHRDLHSFPTRRSSDLITVANAFRRNQRALRIQSFEYVFEALALFPDQVLFGDFQVLEEERSEEHTSELQSREKLVCRLLLEKKNGDSNTETN